jgi:ATP-binding cassette subfamily C protein
VANSEIDKDKVFLKKTSGYIAVNGLKFRYADDMPYLFDGLDLRINAGEYVALVGPSGCGKSTLVRLLLGFEQAESGSIFYDEHNLDDISKPSLRQNCVSICLQDGNLVEGTIRENILFGNTGLSDDDVWEAVRNVALEDDIKRMPNGLDTHISADGQGVSGGQRQRILIARALAMKPSVIICDEATSALDNRTQAIVSRSLDKLKATRIVVAHRLSTIRNADRIIVLDQGRVAESGTFDELLKQNGIFASMVKRQVS